VDREVLKKLFGPKPTWHGACTVLVEAHASVRSAGPDSIVGGGAKNYAPRISSGRVSADAVCFVAEHGVLLLVQRTRQRTSTGEELTSQFLLIVDTEHVAGLEFEGLDWLDVLDIAPPELPTRTNYAPGTLVG
jgi:hypothetical protein